jgi:oxygen-dependent protoporphyrinogen oxidase
VDRGARAHLLGTGHGDGMKIAVVGAGIAGLALAYRLSKNHEVVVLERDAAPGGKIRSQSLDGFLFEWGPNGFLSSAQELSDLIDEIGLGPELVRASPAASKRSIYWDGKLHALPAKPQQAPRMSIVSLGAKLGALREPFVKPYVQTDPDRDESIYDFVARRLGIEFAERLISPALLGVTGGDARQTSLDAVFPRMRALERDHGSLIRGAFASKRRPGHLSNFGARGMARPVERLAELLGSRLQTGKRAVAVRAEAGRWAIDVESDGARETLDCDRAVFAIPAYDAADVLGPLDPQLRAELQAIPYAPMRVSGLAFRPQDVPAPLDGFGFLVARNFGVRILGALFTSTLFPMQAPPGVAYLRVFMGGALDPEGAMLDEDRARAVIRNDLRATLGIAADPLFYHEYVWPRAIAQYRLDHRARVRRIEERLRALPGLDVAGNAFRGLGLGDNVRDALALAARIDAEGTPGRPLAATGTAASDR